MTTGRIDDIGRFSTAIAAASANTPRQRTRNPSHLDVACLTSDLGQNFPQRLLRFGVFFGQADADARPLIERRKAASDIDPALTKRHGYHFLWTTRIEEDEVGRGVAVRKLQLLEYRCPSCPLTRHNSAAAIDQLLILQRRCCRDQRQATDALGRAIALLAQRVSYRRRRQQVTERQTRQVMNFRKDL